LLNPLYSSKKNVIQWDKTTQGIKITLVVDIHSNSECLPAIPWAGSIRAVLDFLSSSGELLRSITQKQILPFTVFSRVWDADPAVGDCGPWQHGSATAMNPSADSIQ
jgi:hypothetical protein